MVENNGGRIQLEINKEVRFLNMEGIVSDLIYKIDSPHTDRKARATLRNGENVILVHHKRLLDKELHNVAIALLGNKEIVAVCPGCKQINVLDSNQVSLNCCKDKKVHFMSEVNTVTENQESQSFDLSTLTGKYEVWVKDNNKKFTESINIKTVQIVLKDAEIPRKFIFNLYNDKLTTGNKESNFAEKLAAFDTAAVVDGKKIWHTIDKDKYAKHNTKQGYVCLTA